MNTTCCLRLAYQLLLSILIIFISSCAQPEAGNMKLGAPMEFPQLSLAEAARLSRLASACIQVEYPNKLSHVMNDETELASPQALHPAFYGCFDWHSSVHGHWMLVRLLKEFPDLPDEQKIREMLNTNLSQKNIEQEVAYLNQAGRKSFERTYGWAWVLQLALELENWDDPDGKSWAQHLAPLSRKIEERYLDFLPRQTYPIRTGLHPNTAFGLSFAYDYAKAQQRDSLRSLISSTAKKYFLSDRNCPGAWEPGGSDFLSPCLEEANLMRRILPIEEFEPWLDAFLPGLGEGKPISLFQVADVADRSDPQIVHLDGLNLSRAWCMLGIASVLDPSSSKYQLLVENASLHLNAALPHITSGNYEGEHWLASFAVYTLSLANTMQERIKVACVGNSITFGAGIKERERNSYPAQLGRILGPKFEVKNFGISGRTLLQKGDFPYRAEKEFKAALTYHPDIVIIKLGTNDTKPQNWQYEKEFEADLEEMINSFSKLDSSPKIYLCKPVPAYQLQWGINDSIIYHGVIPKIEAIARQHSLEVIDLYEPLSEHPEWFPDHIHPNASGAGKMAEVIAESIR